MSDELLSLRWLFARTVLPAPIIRRECWNLEHWSSGAKQPSERKTGKREIDRGSYRGFVVTLLAGNAHKNLVHSQELTPTDT